jgi:hypothetical protein
METRIPYTKPFQVLVHSPVLIARQICVAALSGSRSSSPFQVRIASDAAGYTRVSRSGILPLRAASNVPADAVSMKKTYRRLVYARLLDSLSTGKVVWVFETRTGRMEGQGGRGDSLEVYLCRALRHPWLAFRVGIRLLLHTEISGRNKFEFILL